MKGGDPLSALAGVNIEYVGAGIGRWAKFLCFPLIIHLSSSSGATVAHRENPKSRFHLLTSAANIALWMKMTLLPVFLFTQHTVSALTLFIGARCPTFLMVNLLDVHRALLFLFIGLLFSG